MSINETQLAKDLIALSGISMSQIARDSSIIPANLSNWLRGSQSALGGEAKDRLFSQLGIAGGKLDPRRIHFWFLKSPNLDPFNSVMLWLGQPVEIIHVAPTKLGFRDILPDNYLLPLLAYNEQSRVFLRRRVSPLDNKIPVPDPAQLPKGSHWKKLPPDTYFKYPVLRLPNEIFDRALEKDLSIEEFDQIFRAQKQTTPSELSGSTWEEVVQEHVKMGHDPASALKWIRSIMEASIKE